MRRPLLFAAVWLIAAAVSASADRVGFREEFSSAGDWEVSTWPGMTGLGSITGDGQQVTFTTLVGTFMTGATAAWLPDWPDWDKNTPAGMARISRRYPVTVDLDRYHYLVARMTHSGTYTGLAINGQETKVCYAPGLHAVDLRDIPQPSLRGTQPIELRLSFLNTGGRVALDEVRLVESLSPEERAGFIPAGLDLRLQRLDPKPYHGLEALNSRAGSPVRFDLPEEKARFRDTSTGAVVWRMTNSVRTEMCGVFNADGSALPIANRSYSGMVFHDLARGAMRELPDSRGAVVFSRRDPSVIYTLQTTGANDKVRYVIRWANFRTGATGIVAGWESADGGGSDLAQSPHSDLLLVGPTGGRALYLINPREEDGRRVRRVPLSMRMKGAMLSHDDGRVNWHRCYFFQRWQMDLGTGAVAITHHPTYGGHDIQGRDCVVGRYTSMMLIHKLGILPCDEQDAGQVRIWSNWKEDVPSDYGQLSDDDRWLVTNGTHGDIAGKRLLIDGRETGTVLQIVHDFTSRNSWDSNTYSRISPDATKLAYMCDMLGDTDVYLAITRRPAAPRGLTLAREGAHVRLRWQPPLAAREIAAYNVYRSRESGRGYRRVNRERITKTEFVDTPPAGPAFYAVAAEEHCGLEGLYSAEAHTAKAGSYRVYADLEEGELTPPLRHHFDGDCSNYRCARVWKEAPDEVAGHAALRIAAPAAGAYHLWVRAKGRGEFRCTAPDGSATGRVRSDGWSWTRAAQPLRIRAGAQQLLLRSSDDGVCLDLALLTTTPTDRPSGLDGRDPVPSPVRGLRVAEVSPGQARIAWEPSRDADTDVYSTYVGDRADFVPGNASLLTTGRGTECLDWGPKPGSTLYYKVVALNKRGVASPPAALRVEIPAMPIATLELPIENAVLSGGLERGETKGVACAFLPSPAAPQAPHPRATWKVNVPLDGVYYVWARYTTLDAKRVSLFWVECDGQAVKGGNWRLRLPCTLTRHQDGVKPGEETWFTDKMASGWWAGPFDSVDLTAGAHTLSVAFEPTHAPNGPRLSALYLSSDPSYRAPGFDPRVDFRK